MTVSAKQRLKQVPDAKNFCRHIHRKGSLELSALLPPLFVVLYVHLICEGNLLAILCGNLANLGGQHVFSALLLNRSRIGSTGAHLNNHARQHSCGMRAA